MERHNHSGLGCRWHMAILLERGRTQMTQKLFILAAALSWGYLAMIAGNDMAEMAKDQMEATE
jgi:hypothetical protein